MNTIKELLRYRRPAGSKTELAFVEQFLATIPDMSRDGYGNISVVVGDATPTTMFSCHTDTVHNFGGEQRVRTNKMGLLYTKGKQCLGADDTAGIWIMLNMIDRDIPGLYIFHRDEEIGCKGSRWIYDNTPDRFNNIDRSIAFDRRGYDSIVTHQLGRRCCSDEFATALSGALNMGHQPDDGGIYTDNENYIELISEVTNVSVGYEFAHSSNEQLDPTYLSLLLESLSAVDFGSLPVERDPALVDELSWYTPRPNDDIYNLVIDFPDIAAQLLDEFGCTVGEFNRAVLVDYTRGDDDTDPAKLWENPYDV